MTLAATLETEAAEAERRAAADERLAAELAREGSLLAPALDAVLRSLTAEVWRGPGAGRFRDGLHLGRARLRATADELDQVAALLRRRAAELRARSAGFRRQAGAVSMSAPPGRS